MYSSTVNSSTMYGREFHIPDVVLPSDEPVEELDADEDWVDRLTDALTKALGVVTKQDSLMRISEGVLATEVNTEQPGEVEV
jgi:hypothetical protein